MRRAGWVIRSPNPSPRKAAVEQLLREERPALEAGGENTDTPIGRG
jgi:hypothetical protein